MNGNNNLSSSDNSVFFDTSKPNMARIFDYLTGGYAHFEIDREAAHSMLAIFPGMRKWVRLGRAFVQEAARHLYQQGFVQYLDLGSGMPTDDHIHTIAPAAKVIYTDLNPVAVNYGQNLFAQLENVTYLWGDARHIDHILMQKEVQNLANNLEKIAIGLNSLMLYFPPEANQALAQALYDWAPAGSQIFHLLYPRNVAAESDLYQQFQQMTGEAGFNMRLYTIDECRQLMAPWHVKMIQPVTTFLGLPEDFITDKDKEGLDMDFTAAFFEK